LAVWKWWHRAKSSLPKKWEKGPGGLTPALAGVNPPGPFVRLTLAPAFYLMAAALGTTLAALAMPGRAHKPLP